MLEAMCLQQKRVLILTGTPGVGKTTVLTKTVEMLRKQGYNVGGMLSHEVREGGVRVGFEIQDLASDKRVGWHMLARRAVLRSASTMLTSKTLKV